MNNNPIGLFDSGLGGLSVWREIKRNLPEESLFYFGDGKNCPYGSKTVEQVRQFTHDGVAALIDQGCKMLVVACNAATASAIESLRAKYDFPIIGMEPAVKPAAISTKSGIIGVLATERTLKGELFRQTAAKYGDNVKIISAVGWGFVELVEQSLEHTPQALEQVRLVVEPIIEAGADRIVLGCTHYPFLKDAINVVINGRAVEVIDPAAAIERRVEHMLDRFDIRVQEGHKPEYKFFSAAGEQYAERVRLKSESI